MQRSLYVLDLAGVAVFAASGALAGMGARFDLLGVLVLAAVTAIGGGTLRDLLLDRHPIFWIADSGPVWTIVAATGLVIAWAHFQPVPAHALLIADALGLALFAMTGARVAESAGCPPIVVVVLGTLSGAGGGVVRDVLTDRVPLIFRQDIYASAAIVGIVVHLLLRAAGAPSRVALAAGLVVIVVVRLAAVAFGLGLPVPPMPR